MKENLSFMDVTDDLRDLAAYSYAGQSVEEPALVAYPASLDDVRRTLLYCNRVNIPVVPRGLGTNVTGATTGRKAVILDMCRFNRVHKIDNTMKQIAVEPGVILSSLNTHLRREGYAFPIQPYFSSFRTVGGMVASNAIGPHSFSYGRMEKWVRQVDILDGTGKFYELKEGFDRVVGREGTTGVIVRVHLRLTEPMKETSVSVFSYRNVPDLLAALSEHQKEEHVLGIDYLNRAASIYTGLDDTHHLIIEYSSKDGTVSREKTEHALARRDGVHDALRLKGYYHLFDAAAAPDKLFDVLNFADDHDVAAFGPIGLNTVMLMFKRSETGAAAEKGGALEEFKRLAGQRTFTVGSVFGYGPSRKEFVPYDVKNAVIRLKDEYDYNNIMNRGKIVDFR
jgi:FAD/FMN-containing dehydrogenase